MMSRLQLLLLDADVIIFAHELGIWDRLVECCSITVTETVVSEAKRWEDNSQIQHPIDLESYVSQGRIAYKTVPLQTVMDFARRFGATYLDRMDPGESESLAFLEASPKDAWLLCSGDGIVFKVLGSLGKGEQGISFEEVLARVGLSHPLDSNHRHFSRTYRERLTKQGQRDQIAGSSLKS